MKPLGLKGLWRSLRSANGPAQHMLIGVWGIIAAAGFYDVNVPNVFLVSWVLASIAVIYCTVWASKPNLLIALKIDAVLSAMVLSLYLFEAYTAGITTLVFFAGRLVAGSVLVLHGLYLVDLVQRQIFEATYIEDNLK